MRPPHALALGSVLLVGVAAACLAGPAVAADPVAATNGTTYEHGTSIAIDVETNGSYALYTADDAFVAEFAAENGTVVVDTGDLENGDYVLTNASEATVFAFGVEGAPTTTTTTEPAKTTNDTDRPDDKTLKLEDGSTYDAGVTLTRDVAGDEYTLETTDGEFVMELAAQNGTLTVETDGLDGEYVLRDADGTAVATFTVEATDETTTTTTTTTSSASVSDGGDSAGDDAPLDQTVAAENDSVYWQGLTLRFDVDADHATLRTADGAFVGEYAADNGTVTVETAGLDTGDYWLNASGTVHFSVARQFLDAADQGDTLGVTSNRAGYPLVLQSSALSDEQLRVLVPASETRDGHVVVSNLSHDATLELDESVVAPGNYSVTAVAGDTGVRDDATVTVRATSGGSATSTTTGPAENGATGGANTTSTATSTTSATTTTPPATNGGSPGFGLAASALALGGAALLARRD
ncbi:hypothetical protein [Halarchaeum sp. P4]|uniref:hypothetical protein n=1 Tax=Halarchaeum sp. P4 TaxID=3421639 RepID=UPI003EBA1A5F